jgi:excisionase family DNA binding protein
MKRLYTAQDLAEMLSCTTATIYNQVRLGAIPHIRIGRLIRFDPDEIDRWIRERHGEAVRKQS